MKTYYRLFALIIVLAMVTAMLTGCSDNQAEPSSTPSQTATASVAPSPEQSAPQTEAPEVKPDEPPQDEPPQVEPGEDVGPGDIIADPKNGIFPTDNGNPADAPTYPISLPLTTTGEGFTVWMGMSPAAIPYINDYTQDNLVFSILAERTGVDIKFEIYHPDTTNEKFSLMFAADEYMDVLDGRFSYTGGKDQAIEDGAFIELSELSEKYAPNFWSKISYNKELWEECTTSVGNLASFVTFNNDYVGPDSGLVIRGDWLDKVGLDVPTTVDEMYEVLCAFRDQIGVDGPLWIPTNCVYNSSGIMSAFGASNGMYQKDGTVHYGAIEPEFKEYLTLLNKWYEEDLIWKEFPYYGAQEFFRDRETITTGGVGLFISEIGEFQSFASAATDPDCYFVACPTPVLSKGDTLHTRANNPGYLKSNSSWTLTKSCANPEIVCKFVDYMYTDEGSMLCNYGVEGVTFNYNENGQPLYTDLITNNETFDYRVSLLMYVCDVMPYVLDANRGKESYNDAQLEAPDVWMSTPTDGAWAIPLKAELNSEESAENTNITADINTYISETVVQFVIGLKPLSEFDEFVSTIESMNVERSVQLTQNAYNRYLAG